MERVVLRVTFCRRFWGCFLLVEAEGVARGEDAYGVLGAGTGAGCSVVEFDGCGFCFAVRGEEGEFKDGACVIEAIGNAFFKEDAVVFDSTHGGSPKVARGYDGDALRRI